MAGIQPDVFKKGFAELWEAKQLATEVRIEAEKQVARTKRLEGHMDFKFYEKFFSCGGVCVCMYGDPEVETHSFKPDLIVQKEKKPVSKSRKIILLTRVNSQHGTGQELCRARQKGKEFLAILFRDKVLTPRERLVLYNGKFWYRGKNGWELLSS